MGTPEFAVPSLERLLQHNYAVAAAVTAPDKPRGRGQAISATPVKRAALQYKIPLLQPESLKDPAFIAQLQAYRPDLMVVVAFRILPREVFTIPPLGSFNLHASLLPKYRGAAPINWAIINGETETGVTTFFLEEKIDTGKIIMQARVPIGHEDDAGTVHDRLAALGAEVVLETVHRIEGGKVEAHQQDETAASPAPKIFKDDCKIGWNQPAVLVHNRIRGLSPFPTAFTLHGSRVLKIYRSRVLDYTSMGMPGEVRVVQNDLRVATSDYCISILELQQEGRKRMGVAEFLRGYGISTGDRFQ